MVCGWNRLGIGRLRIGWWVPDAGSLFVDAGFVLSPNAKTTGFLGFPAAELGVRPHD